MKNGESRESILIVDDTPANLEVLIRLFHKEGYRMRALTSGPMALRAMEHEIPDIVLLDVSMPEMNGYQVCQAMKASESLKDIPVIFISALSEVFDKVTAFESGGVDYITKPVQIEEALARVKTHLALHHYKQLLEEKNRALSETLNQLRETQSHLISSEKMASIGVLTAGIAHEINNPVSFINSSLIGLSKDIRFFLDIQNRYTQLMCHPGKETLEELEQYKQDHDYEERLEEIVTLTENILAGSKRISGIVQSLRTFSRPDEHDMKEVNLIEIIESTLVLLHHKVNNRIEIIRQFGEIPPINCFPAKISQVIMNLLTNAIDAIEAKGGSTELEKITLLTGIRSVKDNSFATVTIQDTGCGINEETLKKIFDPFFTTKPVGKGMGLGLSISNEIIRAHGGWIEVTKPEAGGASFTLFLPQNTTNL